MKRYYHICKLNITLDAPYFFESGVYSRLFEVKADDKADIYYHISYCDSLPERREENKDSVFLDFPMGADEGSVVVFDSKTARDIYVYIIKRNAHILMDERFIFDTLKLTDIMMFHNVMTLHSSLVNINNSAVHFCAPSGTGKSTQAELWKKYRSAKIINGDKSALIFTPDGVLSASLPFCGTSGICENYYINTRAAVFLSQGDKNVISRPDLGEIFSLMSRDIVANTSVPVFASAAAELILKTAQNVDIFSLSCLPDVGAVETLEHALSNKTEGMA